MALTSSRMLIDNHAKWRKRPRTSQCQELRSLLSKALVLLDNHSGIQLACCEMESSGSASQSLPQRVLSCRICPIAHGPIIAQLRPWCIPEVDLASFLSRLAPPPPDSLRTEAGMEGVMKELQEGSPPALRKTRNGYVWRSFPKQPAKDSREEPLVFSQLEDLANDIARAAARSHAKKHRSKLVRRFAYRNNGNRAPESYQFPKRNDDSRPHGYFLLSNATNKEKPRWWDIGLVGEFKACNKSVDTDDNIHKVLWGLNHIMRDDPLRRAAYGFTIENTSTRLWYCNHSQAIASITFKFFKDPIFIVRFFLAALYADKTAFRWDPTITRISCGRKQDKDCQYKITIHNQDQPARVYCTIKLLSDLAADGILRCATRVWSAYLKGESKSNLVIIKDCWVDLDQQREAKNIYEICTEIASWGGREQEVLQYLPTICAHGDVLVLGLPSVTPSLDDIYLSDGPLATRSTSWSK
ncbi:uncharacterized protein PHACADRAFT_180644 [Phanerochaete carnosa HHB-10118-sp]|uniref:Fungal-type protein kinase domain-containing protein n=1 Tax=Phanerochaete carnosa (strain HHB-10118-sp) TaxID=650164 RepID=K5WQK7_PHACS|nr:uncharacterized protein PHACADRAFT_180644 [Phanerochaete carnosa HHB-10118-sp]EKM61534.1 hypothetical protein PHACADRAFT_180644 [Phanerochaete carnosa HHB-10118-sp]